MKHLIIIVLMLAGCGQAGFSQETVHLWPGEVPGETKEKAEAVSSKDDKGNITRVDEVTDPLFTVHRPAAENHKGAGVIVCPGGGYHILAMKKEGYEVAEWLNGLGYTAFVLQYRVPQKKEGALMDIQRAIRLIRSNAASYGIGHFRLGVLGFSAGGSLAARTSTLYDKQTYDPVGDDRWWSARPDFTVLIYPAYLDQGKDNSLTPELEVDENTPPMFLFAAANDKHATSSMVMARALRNARVPAELHIYPSGGHGYGLRAGNPAAETWPVLAEKWLERFVKKNVDSETDNQVLLMYYGIREGFDVEVYQRAYEILSVKRDASFAGLSENEAFQSLCERKGIKILGGPVLGNISTEGASIWTRTVKPAEVMIKVFHDREVKIFGPERSSVDHGLATFLTVTGLDPGTTYPYELWVDGEKASIPENASIETLPDASGKTETRIVFGSCFHRWGLGNRKQVNAILRRDPDAMLLLGDIAVQDRNDHLGMHRADYLARDFYAAWSKLAASVPIYATWDDHDYFDNDKAGIPEGYTKEDKESVREIFKNAWNNPAYGFGEQGKGIFFRTRIGPADVIQLDERYFRTGKEGSFLGEKQMKWLKEQLPDCRGPFIILGCGTMWSDFVSNGKDSWGRYDPGGRESIFRLIEENNIRGVLLISGDRHGARGFHIVRPSGFSFYEFETGSLGGRSGPPARKEEWDTQLFGVTGRYAFGEFTFKTGIADPEVIFRLIDENGLEIYAITLKQSQLTPGDR